MSLPTKEELGSLDYNYWGQPAIEVHASSSPDTNIEFAYGGYPIITPSESTVPAPRTIMIMVIMS